jgi:nicotinamide-nucleotide adenylyltransferase
MASGTSLRGIAGRVRAASPAISAAPRSESAARASTVAHASSTHASYGVPGESQPLPTVLEQLRGTSQPTLILLPPLQDTPASVALLAGSFDPLTVGHAAMAGAAAELAELVVLVYSARTLAKEGLPPPALLDELDRVRALERFCASHGYAAGLCSHGLLVDQVRAADRLVPSAELTLVMGSDKLLQLLDPRWYDDVDAALDPLFHRATVAFAMRAGDEAAVADALARPRHARWAARIRLLEIPAAVAAVASRGVRERIARGEDVSQLVPEEFLGLL